jgi:hypothetical protein
MALAAGENPFVPGKVCVAPLPVWHAPCVCVCVWVCVLCVCVCVCVCVCGVSHNEGGV